MSENDTQITNSQCGLSSHLIHAPETCLRFIGETGFAVLCFKGKISLRGYLRNQKKKKTDNPFVSQFRPSLALR